VKDHEFNGDPSVLMGVAWVPMRLVVVGWGTLPIFPFNTTNSAADGTVNISLSQPTIDAVLPRVW